MSDTLYATVCEYYRETALLETVAETLAWDERTNLPPGGAEYRGEQLAYLAREIHRRRTAPQVGEWLQSLAGQDLSNIDADADADVREMRREYERRRMLPEALVSELARLTVEGQQVWAQARQANDFASFRPVLERIVARKREEAEALRGGGADTSGGGESLYDALLEDYEPGATAAKMATLFAALRDALAPLVKSVVESGREAPTEILRRLYPIEAQRQFSIFAAKRIGFDFDRGRIDVSAHPFCSGIAPSDCRLTTRYSERLFPNAFFGTLHESGHGLYEQGLRKERHGLPSGTYLSLGIHESQSLMWENFVGRSRGFWRYFFPAAQGAFPEALGDVDAEAFYFAINGVRPSLIRVDADQATYSLHVIVRFELEMALLDGSLAVSDLPGAWNEKYRKYLGVESPTDSDGVLQDVHWSAGLFGYFPTYTLGHLNGAQLFEQARNDLGDLDEQFARCEFRPLLDWLREKVHRVGRTCSSTELIERVTGRPLSQEPFLTHLRRRLGPLYGIA